MRLSRSMKLLRSMLRPAVLAVVALVGSTAVSIGQTPAVDTSAPIKILWGFKFRLPLPISRLKIPSDKTVRLAEAPLEEAVAPRATYHTGLKGTNYIIIEIGTAPDAASAAASIRLTVGNSFDIVLLGGSSVFVPGAALRYNLPIRCTDCYKTLNPDDWDRLRLQTSSSDGILIHRVVLVRSSVLLLDVVLDTTLDRYHHAVIDLSLDSAFKKWEAVNLTRVTALYYAGQDLGQTGSKKYVNKDVAWCSEFTSYMIRQNGLSTPTGSITTGDMKGFFAARGRLYTRAQMNAGAYRPRPGDYMSLWDGQHSVLFRDWVGGAPAPGAIASNKQFYTIEGNVDNMVHATYRQWSDVEAVGNAQ